MNSPLHHFACNRRDMLRTGGLGCLGLGMASWLGLGGSASAAAAGGFGKAKRCILLFMWGGPSQLDTLDPKPHAPAEVRGEFKPQATQTPGIEICEHFHELAKVTDRVAIVRSLHHDDPAHLSSAHLALCGSFAPVVKSDATPPSDRDAPHIGAVLAQARGQDCRLPPFVTMPWKCFHPAAPGGQAPGQHGGWLGQQFDPLLLGGDLNAANWRVPELTLPADMSIDRLQSRRDLLGLVDAQRRDLASLAAKSVHTFQQKAFDLLATPEAYEAFDLSKEPDAVRERYGRNQHGQCVLLARRLVERGVPFVNVNWHNDGQNFWDTHGQNFKRLKNDLIPPADRALAALLGDLAERGLLDETLVVWVGEFGRRPQITANNAGREHWPWCYSGLFAGGGIRGGQVYGSSDAQAAYPAESPVTPQDFAATMYHALGVNPATVLYDRQARPHTVCHGDPLVKLFG